MIGNWLKNWWANGKKNNAPIIYSKKKHGIGKDSISPAAYRICEILHQNGFEAFVVGGAVRDLLLHRQPKDFDVATNATPDELRKIFERSRIIGRRFKIVHVLLHHETIEVTTFRAKSKARTTDEGRLINDNQFGTQQEDATRRDFTVNALYFDPLQETITDYFNGVSDLKNKKLVVIGHAQERFREDPVRMLRAVRLSAKLQMDIEEKSARLIVQMADLLKNEPPARLFDETVKIFTCGQSLKCLRALRQFQLDKGLLPLLDAVIAYPNGRKFIRLALGNSDRRIAQGKGISAGFLFATLLWQEVRFLWENDQQEENKIQALNRAIEEVLEKRAVMLAVPRRILGDVRDIWALQPRFEKRQKNRAYKLLAQSRFRAAFDFLSLRQQVGEVSEELVCWWEDFQFSDDSTRAQMLADLAPVQKGNKKRRRKKKKPSLPSDSANENQSISLDGSFFKKNER